MSDCWKGYTNLSSLGYTHAAINHSDPEFCFVAEDGVKNTQKIESAWRPFKNWMRQRQIPDHYFASALIEYQWRHNIKKEGVDSFEALLDCVRHFYS